MHMSSSHAKILGLVGIIISVSSLILTIHPFFKSAGMISLTRDVAWHAIATSDVNSMRQWIDVLASSWAHSLMPIPILAILLLLYSSLLLSVGLRKG